MPPILPNPSPGCFGPKPTVFRRHDKPKARAASRRRDRVMKSIRNRAWLYMAALALAGVPLLAAPDQAAAQEGAIRPTTFNPPPCDYNDTFYEDNGVIPGQVVGRFGTARRTGPPAIAGHPVNWVADANCSQNDPDRRNFRIL